MKKGRRLIIESATLMYVSKNSLLLEEVLDGLVGDHLLIEDVGTRLGALHHLDNLGIGTTVVLTRLQCSDYFLCHG